MLRQVLSYFYPAIVLQTFTYRLVKQDLFIFALMTRIYNWHLADLIRNIALISDHVVTLITCSRIIDFVIMKRSFSWAFRLDPWSDPWAYKHLSTEIDSHWERGQFNGIAITRRPHATIILSKQFEILYRTTKTVGIKLMNQSQIWSVGKKK